MKSRYDGDCSIYACLSNNIPEAGICTCGYGHQLMIKEDYSKMYSKELSEKLEKESNLNGKGLYNTIQQLKQKLESRKTKTTNPNYVRGVIKILEENS